MKKLQFALAAFLLASTISYAQPATKQDRKLHGKMEQKSNLEALNLSEDQKTQMKAINEDFKTQMKALNSDETQTVKQQRDKRMALAQAHKAKLDNLLTTEQKTKMAAWKSTGKQRHAEMSEEHLNKMKLELNLTDAQANELNNNQAALKAKMDAIQNNTSLDATAKRQQMSALKAERKAMMDKVLTPEQQKKFQGMHKERKGDKKMHKGKRTQTATV